MAIPRNQPWHGALPAVTFGPTHDSELFFRHVFDHVPPTLLRIDDPTAPV